MEYYYLYDPSYFTWVQCGARAAYVDISRTDTFAGSISGHAVTYGEEFPNSSVYVDRNYRWYVQQYVRTGIDYGHPAGSITFKHTKQEGSDATCVVSYSLPYCEYIGNLL